MSEQSPWYQRYKTAHLVRIGAGTEGIVYTSKEDTSLILKSSIRPASSKLCEKWKRESDIQYRIREEFHKEYKGDEILDYMEIPKIVARIADDKCHIVMERVIPVFGNTLSLRDLNGRAVHPMLSYDNRCENMGEIGIHIGRDMVKKIYPISILNVSMARFLAFIQFKLGYDGNDIEYLLSPTKMYVIDFGKVGPLTPFEKYKSTGQTNAFNAFDSKGGYYFLKSKEFQEAYIKEADRFGFKAYAEKIIHATMYE